MRDLLRDRVLIWYSLYEGTEDVYVPGIVNEKGEPIKTGQKREIYSDPVRVKVPISPNTGSSEIELFGGSITYDRLITTCMNLGLDEHSRVWVETTPPAAPDFRVVRVAPGKDQNLYAIERIV